MNAKAIWEQIEEVEAKLDLVEATWGEMDFPYGVPVSVHVYMSELFRTRNSLIGQYRKAVAA